MLCCCEWIIVKAEVHEQFNGVLVSLEAWSLGLSGLKVEPKFRQSWAIFLSITHCLELCLVTSRVAFGLLWCSRRFSLSSNRTFKPLFNSQTPPHPHNNTSKTKPLFNHNWPSIISLVMEKRRVSAIRTDECEKRSWIYLFLSSRHRNSSRKSKAW
jgi:hypothetical protein